MFSISGFNSDYGNNRANHYNTPVISLNVRGHSTSVNGNSGFFCLQPTFGCLSSSSC